MAGGDVCFMMVLYLCKTHMALLVMAVLSRRFQLQGHMTDDVLRQFFPDQLLDPVVIPIRYNVHGGIIVLSIQAPDSKNENARFKRNAIKIFFSVFISSSLL